MDADRDRSADANDLRPATSALLDQAQAQYRFLFDHNPIPMWVFELETLKFLAVNDAALEHYGYGRGELLEMTVLNIRPPEHRQAMRDAAQSDAAHVQGRVWTHRRRDGSTLRAEIHLHDVEFDGQPARLVAAHDVTERECSEQRFRLIARATSDAIYDWDIVKDTLWLSDSFYSGFGHDREQMPSATQTWQSLIHPGDIEAVRASLQRVLASDRLEWEHEYRFQRGDGSHAEVLDRGFLMRDARGAPIRMVGGMLDLTEKHRVAAELRLLRRAVENTDSGIVVTDAVAEDHPIVYVNPAFERISGYDADEVLGRNCRFLQGEDRDQPALAAVRHALAEGRGTTVTMRNYRKNGELFWNDFHLDALHDEQGCVTHHVGVLADVTERHRYEEQLAWRATHDDLTGLPNRELLLDRLGQAVRNAARYRRQVAVIFVDLDDFKLVNENLGHGAGDAVLRTIARRLSALVSDTDSVGRFGGDEFVMVLNEVSDRRSLDQVLERATAQVSEPIEIEGVSYTLTPSIGYCTYPESGTTAESLLMRADLAMYQAKQQGRNRAVPYQPEFDSEVSQRLRLISRLREALAREEFCLVFQPIFSPLGRPLGLEALLRWEHPEFGELPPGQFIAVCEESGLIVEIGRWVLMEAARHHRMLVDAGLGHVRLAVNVSAAQFTEDLHADVVRAMQAGSLPPGALELELTESVIMAHPERAIDTMQRLATLGVSISIDDFGTGYSSLAYLKRLPIDRLKIDRSFVRDLHEDANDRSICQSVISLAQSLGLDTVAEGVETQEQLDWLRQHGIGELQGFLLGRPGSFESVVDKLRNAGSAAQA
ncbi:sensor domain-containing protein [Lysobacter sp. A3-1-A15]|uniref:sensor domain-containing protein n=1 Tax=Novilysobacter viscosus TaxID=3098602 RepID=UPI003983D48E